LAAARNNVPAIYGLSIFARDGGLLSYGPDPVDNASDPSVLKRIFVYIRAPFLEHFPKK
jgi:hypothetical protein